MAYGEFRQGAVSFPLTQDLSNSLLRDADPALYYTLAFFKSVIETHVGPRLVAQAQQNGVRAIDKAINYFLPMDPGKHLQDTQVKFPLLAVWRKSSRFEVAAQSYMRRVGRWGVAYVLPPLSAGDAERILPVLSAVEAVLLNRIENIGDPAFMSDANVWALAGVEEVELISAQYGSWTLQERTNLDFPAWIAELEVKERDMAAPDGAFDGDFSGLDLAISSQSGTEAPVTVAEIAITFADPTTIASIVGLWRADAGITSGLDPSRLGSWANQVTAGAALAPATTSSQPIYANDDETHLDLVLGDGTASELTATAASLAGDGARTIVVAFRAWKTDQRGILAMVTNTVAGGTVALELGADGVLKVTACGSTLTTNVAIDIEWHVAVLKIASSIAGSSLLATISLQVDDQPIALTLQSGGGTWASMALATKFGVLGLAADLSNTSAPAAIGVAQVFSSSLSTTDTATAVSFCKQWLQQQP